MQDVSIITKVAPGAEPLLLSDVKARLRVDSTDDDAVLTSMIAEARGHVEGYIKRRLITQTVTLVLNGFPDLIRVPVGPVSSVPEIRYYDGANEEQTLSGTIYQVGAKREPAIVMTAYGYVWPETYKRLEAVEIDAVVGYGAAGTSVPPAILAALYMTIGDLFQFRENSTQQQAYEVPLSVRNLLTPFVLWV